MAEEEVDWDDDWKVGNQSNIIEGNDNENDNANGNANGKHVEGDDDDVISLEGGDIDNEGQTSPPRRIASAKVPPSGPRNGTSSAVPAESEAKKDNQNTTENNGGSSPLPPGWTAIMSKSHNKHFFYHKETNTTVWDKPTSTIQPADKDDQPTSNSVHNEVEADTTQSSGEVSAAVGQGEKIESKPKPNPVESAYQSRKIPPAGPAAREPQQQASRGIETKPHYDKYWAQRDQSYQSQTHAQHLEKEKEKDKRRQRDPSPLSANRNGHDNNNNKRFKGDIENDDRRSGNDFRRQQGPPSDNRDRRPEPPSSKQSDTSSILANDARTRPYNGAYVPPVVKPHIPNFHASRSETRSRGDISPRDPPPSARYNKDYNRGPPPYQKRYDDYDRPPQHRHESAPYESRGSRPPPLDEAEIERAKIRDEARKAQEKLQFLKQAEARLEREMSEKRSRGDNDRDREPYSSRGRPPPPFDDRSGPRPYDQDRRPYPPRDDGYRQPPPSSRYDRGGDDQYDRPYDRGYENRSTRGGYESKPTRGGFEGRSSRGGYDGRPTRGGFGHDSRSSSYNNRDYDRGGPPPRPRSPPISRPLSPPLPPSSKFSAPPRGDRRSPPPPPFAARLGPRGVSPRRNGGESRDLASRIGGGDRVTSGGGRGRGSELAAEPMSTHAKEAIDRGRDFRRDDRDNRPVGHSVRPLAERMSVDRDRGRYDDRR